MAVEISPIPVVLSENLRSYEAAGLLADVLTKLESGTHYFEFHMDKVRDIDSFGLGVLALLAKKATDYGGNIIFRGLTGPVVHLLEPFGSLAGRRRGA